MDLLLLIIALVLCTTFTTYWLLIEPVLSKPVNIVLGVEVFAGWATFILMFLNY